MQSTDAATIICLPSKGGRRRRAFATFFAFRRSLALLAGLIFLLPMASAQIKTMADEPFVQEFHEGYPLASADENDVRAVAVDTSGRVWAATRAGIRFYENGEWRTPTAAGTGVAFDVVCDAKGTTWVGAWNGLYQITGENCEKVREINEPISALHPIKLGVIAAGPNGLWTTEKGVWEKEAPKWPQAVRAVLNDASTGVWLATALGLYNHSGHGDVHYFRQPDELLSGDVRGIALDRTGQLWIGSLGGLTVRMNGEKRATYSTKEGLPNIDVRAIAFHPDGALWICTGLGVSRFTGTSWSLRHSRRWLLSDDTRDVAFDKEGNAWVATGAGVSAIKRRMMTLEEKAKHISDMTHARHVRDPWIVERCRLRTPGDLSTWEPEDDDNDGSYTAFYMVGECFRYAVTKDPEAKANADRAFDVIEMLQTVTETPGFMARTVVPANWTEVHDPNREVSDEQRAERLVQDPRYKQVPVRWRPSKDGKWLWKGDTSSDEITGHFWGFYWYYTLAADDENKKRVVELARRVMDYIIDGGYVLRDTDGAHTRWGVWSPEKLLNDPNWRAERGINAAEVLGFLKVTYKLTGDKKYQEHYEELIKKHGYAELARRAKTYYPSERTHIDDELLSFTYPCLLLCEDDPNLKEIYKEGLDWWYKGLAKDESPYFTFVYGALGGETYDQRAAVEFLRDAPIDLVEWTIDNSTREDIDLVREPEIDPLQTDRMLPASERAIMRWDKNPWMAVSGNGGHSESAGTYWLTPYWMGRYFGFIAAPR